MPKASKPFRDRLTWLAYEPGDAYDGTPERVAELRALGLVDADGGTGDLSKLTVAELRALAAERGLDAAPKATKAALLEILGG